MTEREAGGPLARSELRRRAVAGAAIIGARGVAINVLAFLGNVALARLLVPSEFGTIALGLAVLTLAALLTDGGLGAGLVRRPEPPTMEDLRALTAVQLVTTALISALGLAVAGPLGEAGLVTAIMLCGLPLMAVRGPGIVTLERDLNFRPLAAVDVAEVLAYYAWGIAAVAAGFGVVGLATASIVKALTGTLVLLRGAPVGLVAPRTSWAHVKPLLRFGLRFQGVSVVGSIRDQGASLGTGAVAGTAVLGLWAVAWRLLQVPFLLFQALWQVSFPAMAQLVAGGEDPRPVIERVARLTALATGLVLTPIAASTPALVPALFGPEYAGANEAIPPVCAALQVSGPISVAVAGYLFASDRAGTVLRAALIQVVIWFGIAFPLLPVIGVEAVGIGFGAAALTETLIFSRSVRAATGARVLGGVVLPFLAAALGAGAGWLVADAIGPTVAGAVASAALGTAVYFGAVFAVRRPLVLEALRLARTGVAGAARA